MAETIAKDRERKTLRMDIRLTPTQRAQFERAAEAKGMKIGQWATARLMESARKDIEEASTTWLSDADFDRFAAALEKPVPAAMKALLAKEPIWR